MSYAWSGNKVGKELVDRIIYIIEGDIKKELELIFELFDDTT